MSKLCNYTDVKNIVEEMFAKQYNANYFTLNDEGENNLKELFEYYCTDFPNIVSQDD